MKLDKRIENERLIYTPFATTKPKLHEKGYFTDNIHSFNNLKNCRYGELINHDDNQYSYCCEFNGGDTIAWFAFYIPESSLKREEKQFRPYTFMEFTDIFTVGRPIKYRRKGLIGWEIYLILNGYRHEQRNNKTITYIYIGSNRYTLDELFDNYEWQEHYTEDFEPFGKEVEE